MTKIWGITGSIATGKSYVSDILKNHKMKIYSSDLTVAELLKDEQIIDSIKRIPALSPAIKKKFLNKRELAAIVFNNEEALEVLESIIHPREKERLEKFIEFNQEEDFLVLDIPLLFETNKEKYCDKIITTICQEQSQIKRALKRENMDIAKFNFIINRQTSSNIKAGKSDYLVYTDITKCFTIFQVEQILRREGIV